MKNNRFLGFGIFLLFVGVVWMLINFGVIDYSVFYSLFTLWPLIFVVIGINIIFRKNGIVKLATWMLFLIALILYGHFVDDGYDIKGGIQAGKDVRIEKTAVVENGELKLSLGAINLDVDAGGANLVEASVSDSDIQYLSTEKEDGKTVEVNFTQKRKNFFRPGKFGCNLNLNKDVVWDMDVDLGAAHGTFDLSELKVREIDLDAGVGDLDLILGSNHDFMRVKIDSGVTNMDITIPDGAGVRVKVDGLVAKSGLTDMGWEKSGGYYVSPDYDNAVNKIEIDIDTGVGNISFSMAGKV